MLPLLKLHLPDVTNLLVGFLKNEIQKVGISKAVLGLSGGVDSALVAFLAAEALGAQNIYCVLMPYASSHPSSISDAEQVVDMLRVNSERVEITAAVEPLFRSDQQMSQVRKGNIMARARMIILYDRSARENALVLGTGNKTEILLGYSTLHGDAACAINPIGDLYKSQVWKLAAHVGVPKNIIEKAPSADLWVGQTDEGELGFSYKHVDELLYFMIDQRLSHTELIEKGFEENFIRKIQLLIKKNQFKRMPPIVAKVGYRTTNVDFRYLRDWGV
jgi:NAD+ synthase